MKKILATTGILTLLVSGVVIFPQVVLAAWTFEDLFNSDTKSTGDLNGQDGWSGGTAYDVVTSNPYEGDQTVRATSANANMDQSISAVSEGTVYFAMRKDTQNRDGGTRFMTGGSNWATFQFDGTNLQVVHGGGTDTLDSNFTTSQYYVFELNITSTSAFTYRYHDGTSWSSLSSSKTSQTTGSVDQIRMNMGSANPPATGTMYWDMFTPDDPFATTNVGQNALVGFTF